MEGSREYCVVRNEGAKSLKTYSQELLRCQCLASVRSDGEEGTSDHYVLLKYSACESKMCTVADYELLLMIRY